MKRVLITLACSALLYAGVGPTSTEPDARARSASSLPAVTVSPSVSPSLDPNTVHVCEKSSVTVIAGIKAFTKEMERTAGYAAQGDRPAAERTIDQAGTILKDTAGKLRKDAESAQKPELKKAIEDVAAELDRLGAVLTGLSALESFDTKHLEELAQRVAVICGDD